MRFFALVELADRPFVSGQGPADFGSDIRAGKNVVIRNGTIGRSSHHGVHGNFNERIRISDVDFVDYEVAALALNGVQGLDVRNVTASNRKDVPVLGTFSSAQFIKHYIDELVRGGSQTTLTVDGAVLGATDIQTALRNTINATHRDVVLDGLGRIRPSTEPAYGLFHNPDRVVDGNSYSFLVNQRRVRARAITGK